MFLKKKANTPEELNDFISNLLIDQEVLSNDDLQTIGKIYLNLTHKLEFETLFSISSMKRFIVYGDKILENENLVINEIKKYKNNFMSQRSDFEHILTTSEKINNYFYKKYPDQKIVQPLVLPYNNSFVLPQVSRTNITDPEIMDPCKSFISYYEEKLPKYKLSLSDYSIVEFDLTITKNNTPKVYTIEADFATAEILIQLSKKPSTFSELIEKLNDEKFALKIVKNLLDKNLIKQKSDTDKPSPNEVFSLNQDFESEQERVVVALQSDEALERLRERVKIAGWREKEMGIKAAAVFRLKHAGKMDLDELLKAVCEDMSGFFECTPDLIKNMMYYGMCEYIRIDEDQVAHYIA